MLNRRLNHISFRYVHNRLRVKLEELKHPEHPWLTKDAIKLLEDLICPNDIGIEFGSGRSTLWFAERLKHLTSVEDNEVWYTRVSKQIKTSNLSDKVNYVYAKEPDKYIDQAQKLAESSIDFCLVDGICRDECALTMTQKVRSGGLLVIDNVNWFIPNEATHSPDSMPLGKFKTHLWQEFYELTSSWRKIWTTNGVTDTCLYFKA